MIDAKGLAWTRGEGERVECDDGRWLLAGREMIDANVVLAINEHVHGIVPVRPPEVVEMAQARLALFEAGLLQHVQAAIAALPEPQHTVAAIEWEFRPTVRRDSMLVQQLAEALELSTAKLDELFTAAGKY